MVVGFTLGFKVQSLDLVEKTYAGYYTVTWFELAAEGTRSTMPPPKIWMPNFPLRLKLKAPPLSRVKMPEVRT